MRAQDIAREHGTEHRFYEAMVGYTVGTEARLGGDRFPPRAADFSADAFATASVEACIVKEAVFPSNSFDTNRLKSSATSAADMVTHKNDPEWRQERDCFCCKRSVCGEHGDVVLDLRKEVKVAMAAEVPKAALVTIVVAAELHGDPLRETAETELRVDLGQLDLPDLEQRAANQVHHRCDIWLAPVYEYAQKRAEAAGVLSLWPHMHTARDEGLWWADHVVSRAIVLLRHSQASMEPPPAAPATQGPLEPPVPEQAEGAPAAWGDAETTTLIKAIVEKLPVPLKRRPAVGTWGDVAGSSGVDHTPDECSERWGAIKDGMTTWFIVNRMTLDWEDSSSDDDDLY